MKKVILFFLVLALPLTAQEQKSKTNSFFDNPESKEYSLKNILVGGEVVKPGIVDLASLPLSSFPGKDLS
jgi:hypothetical protein